MLQLTDSDNGREVGVAVGDGFELALSENRTTGYQWTVTSGAEPACKLVSDNFQAPTGPPGSGGTHHWQFQAVQPGAGEIGLQYRRPWEKDAAPARTFNVTIRVQG